MLPAPDRCVTGQGAQRGHLRGLSCLPGRPAGEVRWPPIPAAQQNHHRRNEQCPNQERIHQDTRGDAKPDLLHLRAAWIVAMLSASSAGPYMPDIPIHPRPIADTVGPLDPSWCVFIGNISRRW